MFGVWMTEPWNPTSLQPKSSITISTMWRGFEAVVIGKDTDRKKTVNAMRNIPWAQRALFKDLQKDSCECHVIRFCNMCDVCDKSGISAFTSSSGQKNTILHALILNTRQTFGKKKKNKRIDRFWSLFLTDSKHCSSWTYPLRRRKWDVSRHQIAVVFQVVLV